MLPPADTRDSGSQNHRAAQTRVSPRMLFPLPGTFFFLLLSSTWQNPTNPSNSAHGLSLPERFPVLAPMLVSLAPAPAASPLPQPRAHPSRTSADRARTGGFPVSPPLPVSTERGALSLLPEGGLAMHSRESHWHIPCGPPPGGTPGHSPPRSLPPLNLQVVKTNLVPPAGPSFPLLHVRQRHHQSLGHFTTSMLSSTDPSLTLTPLTHL